MNAIERKERRIAPKVGNGRHGVLRVLHSVPGAWLPVTQSWLYDQIRFLPGGVESTIACDRLDNAGAFRVGSLYARDAMSWPMRGIDCALRRSRLACGGVHRAVVGRQHRVQLIHSHFGPEGWRNLGTARRLGARHVVTFYGFDVNCLPRSNRRWCERYAELFASVDLVLCEGEHMASCVVGLGCPADRVRIQRLGVDLQTIGWGYRRLDAGEPVRVLMAASFREKKGLSIGLEALGRMRQELDTRITIIGDATSAPGSAAEKQRMFDAIKRHGLHDRVRLLGFQSHDVLMREAMEHHVFLAPSRTGSDGDTEGGVPVAVIEMAASGMIVVSTMHCDIPGVIQDGTTGFLARENDVDDLMQQVRRAVKAAHRWCEIARDGRRWVAHRFCARAQGERLAAIYAEVCAGWRYHDASLVHSRGGTGDGDGARDASSHILEQFAMKRVS